MKVALGAVLRGLRVAQSKRQPEIADPVGYDAGNLSRVERGKQNIAPDVLEGVCQQLGVQVSEVYRLAERVADGEQVDFRAYLLHREIEGRGQGKPASEGPRVASSPGEAQYLRSSPAARQLVDQLLQLASSGKLPDAACTALTALLEALVGGNGPGRQGAYNELIKKAHNAGRDSP